MKTGNCERRSGGQSINMLGALTESPQRVQVSSTSSAAEWLYVEVMTRSREWVERTLSTSQHPMSTMAKIQHKCQASAFRAVPNRRTGGNPCADMRVRTRARARLRLH